MTIQKRQARIFVALLASMTTAAIILMALGNNPPSAGAFCLSDYYSLVPAEELTASRAAQFQDRWNGIEIYYSGTKAGNIEQLASINGLHPASNINFHFVICNGLGGHDGQIQPTEKWQRQWSVITGPDASGAQGTIRICLIGDDKTSPPTDLQLKRLAELVQKLSRSFNIRQEQICYPSEWR